MIEVLKAYLQVASGVGELTRQRALEAARQALAATPAAAVLPVASAGVDGLAAQASALADELLAAGRQNREMLGQLVRAEVETVVTRLGLDGRSDLQAELATSRARVRELERSLATTSASAKRATATKKATGKKATGKKATAKQSPATKTAQKTSAATNATAKRATTATKTAKKTATKATPKKTAKTTATKTSTARPSTAKTATTSKAATRGTAKRSTATKATSA